MPLIYADVNDELIIKRLQGDLKSKQHLENLGFVVGSNIRIISKIGENFIIRVKDSRVAVSRELASKIFI